MAAAKTRENRKIPEVGTPYGSALLLVTIDFQVLGWRGDVERLVPALSLEVPSKLPNGRVGSAIRLLIEGFERGQSPRRPFWMFPPRPVNRRSGSA